jgi:hypothetical protein
LYRASVVTSELDGRSQLIYQWHYAVLSFILFMPGAVTSAPGFVKALQQQFQQHCDEGYDSQHKEYIHVNGDA